MRDPKLFNLSAVKNSDHVRTVQIGFWRAVAGAHFRDELARFSSTVGFIERSYA